MEPTITELEVEIIPEISEDATVQQNSSYYYPFVSYSIPYLLDAARNMVSDLEVSSCLAIVGIVFVAALYFLHVVALVYGKYRLHRPCQHNSSHPGVSIIKPLIGIEDNLFGNLETLFTVDYHKFEILFCFNTPDDPAVKCVEGLIKKYPDVDTRIFFGGEKVGLNPKINNMMPAYRIAKYPLILISDSGIYMRSDSISDMVNTMMSDEKMALVTQTPFCKDRKGFAAAFEQMYFGTAHARIYLAGNCLQFNCPTGMSSLLKKDALEECGGFSAISGYLAEDYFFGKRLAARGYKSGISTQPALQNPASVTMLSFTNRICRWIKLRMAMMPQIILVEPLQDCFPSGLILSFSLNRLFGADFLTTLIIHTALWITSDYLTMYRMQNRKMTFSPLHFLFFWLLRELSAPLFFIKAALEPSVRWYDNVFHLAWGGRIKSQKKL